MNYYNQGQIIYVKDYLKDGKFYDIIEFTEKCNNLSDIEIIDEVTEINELDDFEEFEEFYSEINSLHNLIELGKKYKPSRKRHRLDLKVLNSLIEPLEELKSVIGMSKVKEDIVDNILFLIQKLDNRDEMMHTVIQGPPGVGKTILGQILGKIYLKLGILSTDNFKIFKRSDLIGKYLGHTAAKTQEAIDSCIGGVMFIDEAYSLGNPEGRDSFSKECIDTINQNLTEKKGEFLCIIAGYKEDLDKCFFAYNKGLSRRFSFRYTIEGYTPEELRNIFIKMVKDINWEVNDKIVPINFFNNNIDHFKYYGGDMESLLDKCKIQHSRRIISLKDGNIHKKKLNHEDLEKGFSKFIEGRHIKVENSEYPDFMYI